MRSITEAASDQDRSRWLTAVGTSLVPSRAAVTSWSAFQVWATSAELMRSLIDNCTSGENRAHSMDSPVPKIYLGRWMNVVSLRRRDL